MIDQCQSTTATAHAFSMFPRQWFQDSCKLKSLHHVCISIVSFHVKELDEHVLLEMHRDSQELDPVTVLYLFNVVWCSLYWRVVVNGFGMLIPWWFATFCYHCPTIVHHLRKTKESPKFVSRTEQDGVWCPIFCTSRWSALQNALGGRVPLPIGAEWLAQTCQYLSAVQPAMGHQLGRWEVVAPGHGGNSVVEPLVGATRTPGFGS